jgi:SAM-dependent methyltransferase
MHPEESVIDTLRRLNLLSGETTDLFASGTRDNGDLRVFRDRVSRVIYLEEHRTGDDVYRKGDYRLAVADLLPDKSHDYEDSADTNRRLDRYRQLIVGKSICDFGCGAGSFLRGAQRYCRDSVGIELQDDYREALNRDGIRCVDGFDGVPGSLDAVFLFHSLEHLPAPLGVLQTLRQKMKGDGKAQIVVEVPHARDFLIEHLELREFVEFTLWSQHLVLHTRESLAAMLRDAGFKSVVVEGVQRYGVSNHLHWLRPKRPGGHKQALSVLETPQLTAAYADALARIDASDTIVAIATT